MKAKKLKNTLLRATYIFGIHRQTHFPNISLRQE
jgi:hypothetical protein